MSINWQKCNQSIISCCQLRSLVQLTYWDVLSTKYQEWKCFNWIKMISNIWCTWFGAFPFLTVTKADRCEFQAMNESKQIIAMASICTKATSLYVTLTNPFHLFPPISTNFPFSTLYSSIFILFSHSSIFHPSNYTRNFLSDL